MKRKISVAILILALMLTLFSCRQAPPEPATQLSDKDSVHLKEDFDELGGKLSEAETAEAASDTASFETQLTDNNSAVVSYEGSEDIQIDGENTSAKTVTINTTGSISLSSPVEALIVSGADGGFTADARAESIILEGDGITADIKSETGTVLVNGKNVTVNVRNSAIEKIIVVNTTAKVNNITDDDVTVMLANGAKVSVPARNTYNVSDNTLQRYKD